MNETKEYTEKMFEEIKHIDENGNEIVDVISEDEKETKEVTETKEEVKEVKETKKVAKKEEVIETKEEDKKVNINELNLTELKELAKERGIKGYSKLKKDELLEVLK